MGVTAAVAAVATAAYTVDETKSAKRQAEKTAKKQEKDMQEQEAALQTRVENEEGADAAAKIRDSARANQARSGGSRGRSGTLLTGPGGVANTAPAQSGGKTLLGS